MVKQRKLKKEEAKDKTPLEKLNLWLNLNAEYISKMLTDIDMTPEQFTKHLGRPGAPGTVRNWLYVNENQNKAHKKDWGRFLRSWLTNTRRYDNVQAQRHGTPSRFSGPSGQRKVPKIPGHGR